MFGNLGKLFILTEHGIFIWLFFSYLAPRNYPVHITVFPNEENSVLVKFRGVSTTVDEEPLLGYKVSISFFNM